MRKQSMPSRVSLLHEIKLKYTPGTRVGPDSHDRTLAVIFSFLLPMHVEEEEERKKEEEKSVLIMASNASIRHHGWSMQAVWTNILFSHHLINLL